MKIKIYQVDAFTGKLFSGNPAAVCPLEEWLPDELMQKIAMENNLAETAFFVKENKEFQIRWFTPEVEVDLCGHATLASAHVLFHHLDHPGNEIIFYSQRSGHLKINREDDLITLNFPADNFEPLALTPEVTKGFNIQPVAAFKGKTDLMLVYENEDQVKAIRPDLALIQKTKARGIIVTARSTSVDFVSRFFAPQSGIDEDPVTGSAHTTLIPYWAKTLGKNDLTAMQLSKRGGYIKCKYLNERVEIGGQAVTYMTGEIECEQTPGKYR